MGERLTPHTKLAPIDDCRAVVAAYDGTKKATVAEAAETVRVLVGSYPQRAGAEDPQIYLSAMIAAFADYPEKSGQIAARDMVKKHRFAPSVAEAVEALEAARSASATLAARARWALAEHERREREARREAELAAIPQATRDLMYEQAQAIVRKLSGTETTQTA